MPKPLAQEEDVIVVNDTNGNRQFLYVYQTEDVVYEDRSTWKGTYAKAATTVTLSTATQMSELEPKETELPEVQIYQLRVGVSGPCLVFCEIMAGTARRGTWKSPRPTSSNYWVGHLNEMMSPYDDPRFEMFLRHNEYPAFAVYNPYELLKAETVLRFVGKKLRCYDLEHNETPKKIGLAPPVVQNILERVKVNNYPHRAITPRGLEA